MTAGSASPLDICSNCGARRTGLFCAECGQNAREYQRPVRELATELVTEQLDLDSRLLRTLKALLFNPGFLTREFAAGRRASYVSPVRLYLLVSVAFFTTLSLSSDLDIVDFGGPGQISVSLEKDPEFLKLFEALSPEQRVRARAILESRGLSTPTIEKELDAIEKKPTVPSTASTLDSRIQDRMLDLIEDPRSVNETVVNHLPFALFLALPLYAVFLKVAYPRRFYAEHLVFALHLHSFLFLTGIVLLLIPENAVGEIAIGALQVLAAVYYFVALHRVQGQTWLKTAAKFVVINVLHLVLMTSAILLTALVVLVQ